jgi:hypothetical protein
VLRRRSGLYERLWGYDREKWKERRKIEGREMIVPNFEGSGMMRANGGSSASFVAVLMGIAPQI